jgi:hypothetical protein
MRKLFYALAICLTSASPAWSQCAGIFGANTVCGNLQATPAPPTIWPAAAITSLTQLSLVATDPNAAPAIGVPIMLNLQPDFTGAILSPLNFNNEQAININMATENGTNSYTTGSCTNVTCSKNTYLGIGGVADYNAAGQHNGFGGVTTNCYGNGDCSAGQSQINYYGGQIAGDEGKGYNLSNLVNQGVPGNGIATRVIGAVTASSCNTTTTQIITGSSAPQTFTVASTSNCNPNDWIQIDHGPWNGGTGTNVSAVQIISIPASGQIRARVLNNYPTGRTVTGATVIQMQQTDMDGMGQQRFLVNLSAAAYTTGTAKGDNPGTSASSSGSNKIDGSGTSWDPGGTKVGPLAGGTTANIGCIYIAADDFTGFPFGSGSQALHSWYPILQIINDTTLNISSWDVATNNSYWSKNGGTLGAYVIRPCIQILYRDIVLNKIIAETTGTTWTGGQNVEVAFFADPDVSMHIEHVATFTAGGRNRSMVNYSNFGARTFLTAIAVDGSQNMATGSGADTVGFFDAVKLGLGGTTAFNTGIEIPGLWSGSAININPQTGATVNNAIQFNNYNGATGTIWNVNMGNAASVNNLTFATAQNGGNLDLFDTLAIGTNFRTVRSGNTLASSFLGVDNNGVGRMGFGIGSSSIDSYLWRDANHVLGINGAYGTGLGQAASGLHIYNNTDSTQGGSTIQEWGAIDFTTTANVLTVGTGKSGTGVTRNMQFVAGGTSVYTLAAATPTANACAGFALGTGSTDTEGKLTYTSATSCAINFGRTFTNAPACMVSPGTAVSTVQVTTSTTVLTATFGTAQTAMSWVCFGT